MRHLMCPAPNPRQAQARCIWHRHPRRRLPRTAARGLKLLKGCILESARPWRRGTVHQLSEPEPWRTEPRNGIAAPALLPIGSRTQRPARGPPTHGIVHTSPAARHLVSGRLRASPASIRRAATPAHAARHTDNARPIQSADRLRRTYPRCVNALPPLAMPSTISRRAKYVVTAPRSAPADRPHGATPPGSDRSRQR